MPTPRFVQVPLSSTGSKIQNLSITQTNPDTGADETVLMQVVVIADANGRPVADFPSGKVQEAILDELRHIKELLLNLR